MSFQTCTKNMILKWFNRGLYGKNFCALYAQVSLVLFNGFLLAIGGFDGVSDLKTMEAYGHETNSWRCVLF